MVGLAIALLLAGGTPAGLCSAPPEYYKVELVPTRRVPAARMATGVAHLTFTESPFGIAISDKGHYRYDVEVVVDKPPAGPEWPVCGLAFYAGSQAGGTTLGPVAGPVRGRTEWNKFLVIITLEPPRTGESCPVAGARWSCAAFLVAALCTRWRVMVHSNRSHAPVYGYY